MRFLLLKDLTPDGKVTDSWVSHHTKLLENNPAGLKAEYVKLVKSIRTMHRIEETLRKEIFAAWELTAPVWTDNPVNLPDKGTTDFRNHLDIMSRFGDLFAFFTDKALDKLMKKL